MNRQGTIFDIKQLAVFDGPGIRTTVFLKGCPLRCMWCHNPEGLTSRVQLMRSENGCLHCGRCRAVCRHPEECITCGTCINACPKNLIHISGHVMTSGELTERLRRDKKYLENVGGGITFSGGEPMFQPEFLLECLDGLQDMHTCIETSGYAVPELYKRIIDRLDYVIMDLKMVDEKKHRYYTGVSNQVILENLKYLKNSGKPFRIRIPVIPGVNDSPENFRETARLLTDAKMLDFVELLPYHTTAGAKYKMVGMEYRPEFDEGQQPRMDTAVFAEYDVPCRKM
ncbi:MAG: glycyl-radical enzyme activating protein [Lachnospiraceae bacterium]|nr:glycyl-radical enzyme activating protein [Lachnospiraceae bacterium]